MYVATINVPGYLPMDNDPPVFDTAREAWEYLATERREAEDSAAEVAECDGCDQDPFTTPVHYGTCPLATEGYSATVNTLESVANGTMDPADAGLAHDGTGSIGGATPGYTGDHDLGLVYSVTEDTTTPDTKGGEPA